MNAAQIFNALIKTHHITSRKKIARLKKSAHRHLRYALIRSGGSPGIMYAEGYESGLKEWVEGVSSLRYKDYHVLRRPSPLEPNPPTADSDAQEFGFQEVENVADFASKMKSRGVLQWWRQAMGFKDGNGD